MHRIASCLVLALLAPFGPAYAQPTDDSLRVYAVNIVQDPPQDWTGYGIYLGNGRVITAAHVVGQASRTKPSVRIGDLLSPVKAIRESERQDLTLLSIDEQKLPVSLRLRRMPLCENAPWVGELDGSRSRTRTTRSRQVFRPGFHYSRLRAGRVSVLTD